MSELEHFQDRFTVAAQTLIQAYGDLRVRGYDKEPNLTAAALDEMEGLVRQLRAGGFGADGDPAAGRVDLIEAANEYGGHTCNCDYCLHATGGGDGESMALTFDSWPGE